MAPFFDYTAQEKNMTLQDTAIDALLYGVDKPMPEHPRKGQYAYLRSSDPNIDGAIAKIDRAFPNWAVNNSPHALNYIRRLIRMAPYLDVKGNVYQVTIHRKAEEAYEDGPFRVTQGVLVHESEISKPYNGIPHSAYTREPRFTDEGLRFHIINPEVCIFENCRSLNLRVLGMSFTGSDRKAKLLCEECQGEWTQLLTVMGAK